jgi:hypothetical protein
LRRFPLSFSLPLSRLLTLFKNIRLLFEAAAKVRISFHFHKRFLQSFFLSSRPFSKPFNELSPPPRFLVCGMQRCEFYFDLASEKFTFLNLFLFLFTLQKTTPFSQRRPQMYTENQLPTKIYFQINTPRVATHCKLRLIKHKATVIIR